jgi:4-hydroxy-L-threonine phosphate dehydrogenase PdxA
VCGLNPHAGEQGLFGDEERRFIVPALKDLNRGRNKVFQGPFAADTIFHEAMMGRWDMVLAMVHDQALATFKTVEFSTGAQVTFGLPVVRTSPAHGTAYALAGRGQADPGSMATAIRLAIEMTRHRRTWRA